MSESYPDPNIEEEDRDEDEQEYGTQGKQGLILIIDGSPTMQKANSPTGETPFQVSLKAAFVTAKNFLHSGQRYYGLMIYGVNDVKNSRDMPGVHVLSDLQIPDGDIIKRLHDLVKRPSVSGNEKHSAIDSLGGSVDQVDLDKVFDMAIRYFNEPDMKKKLSDRKIWVLTNNDNPLRNDPDRVKTTYAVATKAQDAEEADIERTLFPYQTADGREFDLGRFWTNWVSYDEHGVAYVPQTRTYEELLQEIKQREMALRVAFRLPFVIFDDFTIGIVGYNHLIEAKVPTPKQVSRQSGQVFKAKTEYTNAAGQTIAPYQMKSAYVVGEDKIVFDKKEVKDTKNFGEQYPKGLVLFGFKPMSLLKPQNQLDHSSYIYPDESNLLGSSSVFANLRESMIRNNVFAVCRMIQKANAAPRLVALYPEKTTLGKVDAHGESPPGRGFYVTPLPYADDKRSPPFEKPVKLLPPELLDATSAVITSLYHAGEYPFDEFNNPDLQRHYALVESTLLQEPTEPVKDNTLPPTDDIYERAGTSLKNLKRVLADICHGEMDVPVMKKAKIAKPPLTLAAAHKAFLDGNLKSKTVEELKGLSSREGWTKAAGLKKDALVDYVKEKLGHDLFSAQESASDQQAERSPEDIEDAVMARLMTKAEQLLRACKQATCVKLFGSLEFQPLIRFLPKAVNTIDCRPEALESPEFAESAAKSPSIKHLRVTSVDYIWEDVAVAAFLALQRLESFHCCTGGEFHAGHVLAALETNSREPLHSLRLFSVVIKDVTSLVFYKIYEWWYHQARARYLQAIGFRKDFLR
ncbi:hypothetical protein SmJEL517_g00399 [Synchytrium microbalum]|uniref:ATP-dependent DNA helicase II subunit 1 n=1 Tax=Synchytrium microbalum TaxID=1806994 RepID=A0A507CIN9_9FUNG|nr:uncharacterized protein SmJEL517_g00399 [Synchytrium microbalum]TPX38014.1 hypothetical protein SmJEL517_g00399 [Synchytrium microbalum]